MKNYYFLLIASIVVITNLSSQTLDATLIELNFVDDSKPRNIVEYNNKFYFSATDNTHGRELWSLDLASNESNLIKDIKPGYNGGLQFSNLVFVNNILFFLADDGNNGNELWRSDGTESGTYMIKNINNIGSSNINNMISYNGKLIFSADDGINGQEIWISNGEENGTYLLKDINLGIDDSDIADIFEFNGKLYFTADNGINDRELWMSDGTSAGTSLIIDLSNDYNGVVAGNNFIIFNNNFYFLSTENYVHYNLWKSDGTAAGTSMVKQINSSMGLTFGAVTNDYFIFSALTNNIGREIWVSDGTGAGTQLLKDIFPGFLSGIHLQFRQFAVLNNKVYFIANDGINGRELWVTDGTNSGTQMVKDIFPGSESSGIVSLSSNGQYLIFAAEEDYNDVTGLWKSDGTMAGTIEIKHIDLNKDYGYTIQFVEVNDKFYFQGADKTLNGIEIWETDGTSQNTVLTVDINHRGSNTSPLFPTSINNNTVFISTNGFNGHEPYVTDGTVSGTSMIKDIHPGELSSLGFSESPDFFFKNVSGNLFFRAYDPTYGTEIYKTDGNAVNTTIVKDISPGPTSSIGDDFYFIEYNGLFLFKANDQIHGGELWRTDGTEAGTFMLKDIFPGPGDGIWKPGYQNYINHYAIMGGYLYFDADDGEIGAIYRTDGTTQGTTQVISIPSSGGYDSGPDILNAIDDKIFFSTNPNNSSYHNHALWVTDGTQNNSEQIGFWPDMTVFRKNHIFNNELYFMLKYGPNCTLMKTDGTAAGTVLLKEDMRGYQAKFMGVCGDYLYIGTGDATLPFSYELWRTDGTPNGTILIQDGHPRDFTCIENKLAYLDNFTANNLWITDGTNKNTVAINVLNGEQLDNNEVAFIEGYSQNKLYFTAGTPISGGELYAAGVSEILNVNDYYTQTNSSENKISIYPNPTKGIFTITSEENLILENIEILDFSGKNIVRKTIGSKSANFDISNLSKGLYIVKIKTSESVITKKIILD